MAAMDDADDDGGQADAGLSIRASDGDAALVEWVHAEIAAAASYAEAARAPSTRHAYARDWLVFSAWCTARALAALPADPRAVAVFLAGEAARGCAPMSIGRRLAAIGHAHRQFGMQPPQQREGAAAIVENQAETSHRQTRWREWQMQRSRSTDQAQRSLSAHSIIDGHFHLQRQPTKAPDHR